MRLPFSVELQEQVRLLQMKRGNSANNKKELELFARNVKTIARK